MAAKRPYAPIRADMTCVVTIVLAKTGDRVNEGDVVIAVEAMKLMNEIEAPLSGEIEVLVEPNQQVNAGDLLAKIYP